MVIQNNVIFTDIINTIIQYLGLLVVCEVSTPYAKIYKVMNMRGMMAKQDLDYTTQICILLYTSHHSSVFIT